MTHSLLIIIFRGNRIKTHTATYCLLSPCSAARGGGILSVSFPCCGSWVTLNAFLLWADSSRTIYKYGKMQIVREKEGALHTLERSHHLSSFACLMAPMAPHCHGRRRKQTTTDATQLYISGIFCHQTDERCYPTLMSEHCQRSIRRCRQSTVVERSISSSCIFTLCDTRG